MAAYDQWMSGTLRTETASGAAVSELVRQILASAMGTRPTDAGGGKELLSALLAGAPAAPAVGFAPTVSSSLDIASDPASAALRSLAGQAVLPKINLSSVTTLADGEVPLLPLRAVSGLLGGLLGLLRGRSQAQGAEASFAIPFELPAARNASVAIGPDRGAGYEFDYRYDGQPRLNMDREATERRVEIQIHALDARSILDRKEELAEAVRQAMSSSGAGQEALLGY